MVLRRYKLNACKKNRLFGKDNNSCGILSLADISKLEYVRLTIEDNKILIKNVNARCTFCGAEDNLHTFKNRFVCAECMRELGKLKTNTNNIHRCVIMLPPL